MSTAIETERRTRAKPLTQREIEVLYFRARGLENTDVARRLGVSTQSVKDSAQNILRKMNAWNMTEAVYRGTKQGLI